MSQSSKPGTKKTEKKDNLLANILLNIAIPAIILSKLAVPEKLGTVNGLLLALLFPLGYGIHDLIQNKKLNFFSVIGLANTGLTGLFTVLELNNFWFAVKEATTPALFGAAVLGSLATKSPLIHKIFLNESFVEVEKIYLKIQESAAEIKFKKLVSTSTWFLAGSFLVSSMLNFGLARYLLQSQPGTAEFNEELAKMMAMSFPVITIPSMIVLIIAMVYFFAGITKITGLPFAELILDQAKNKKETVEEPARD